jgi:hypothetical protein
LYKNKYDRRDSSEIGIKAQNKFIIVAQNLGWVVSIANFNQDVNEHWDVCISKEEHSLKVDVKSQRRVSRWDDKMEEDWVWVEFHSVRPSNLGWLYGSKSDAIAFERVKDFVVIDRLVLISLCQTLVDMGSKVKTSAEARYKLYTRAGRCDLISMIEMKHVAEKAMFIWTK